MINRKAVCFLLFSALMGSFAYGETDNPEDLAREYFTALQKEGMIVASRFMHPDALEEFKSMMLPVYVALDEIGDLDLMGMTFGRETELSALEEMSPEEFIKGILNLIAMKMGSQTLSFDALEVLGTVEEGEFRHVLVRLTVGTEETKITTMEVISFIPYKNTWKLELDGEIKGFAKVLQARVDTAKEKAH